MRPYTDLLLELLAAPSPPRPLNWALQPGWSRYCPHTGEVTSVPHPEERCMVFDVEVYYIFLLDFTFKMLIKVMKKR